MSTGNETYTIVEAVKAFVDFLKRYDDLSDLRVGDRVQLYARLKNEQWDHFQAVRNVYTLQSNVNTSNCAAARSSEDASNLDSRAEALKWYLIVVARATTAMQVEDLFWRTRAIPSNTEVAQPGFADTVPAPDAFVGRAYRLFKKALENTRKMADVPEETLSLQYREAFQALIDRSTPAHAAAMELSTVELQTDEALRALEEELKIGV